MPHKRMERGPGLRLVRILPMHCVGLLHLTLRILATLCLVGGATVSAADKKTITLPRFAYPEPLPALLAAAGREKLNILAREWPPERRKAAAGDELTFLVSLRDGKELRQWVLAAKTVELTEQEARMPAPKAYHRYSATGTELKFEGRRTGIEMVLVGPMVPGQGEDSVFKPEVKRRRMLVNADYLELGFDAACAASLAMRVENDKRAPADRFKTKIGDKPFPPEVTKVERALADEVGFTPERERAFFGSMPALLEFFDLIMKTPGLQDILKEVIDVSWWSLMTSGGKTQVRLEYIQSYIQKLADLRPDLPQYAFPLVVRVNNQPAMAVMLIVTQPKAPFGTTAGVVGIHAGRPYDDERQLTVRLIGSRYSGAPLLSAAVDKD
jgi:hypothetical protein